MKKRSKLNLHAVGQMPDDLTAPPSELDEAGATLWKAILEEFRVDDAPGRQTLLQICHAADIAAVAHARGALKDELQARTFITRGLHRLNFDVAPTRANPGRPSGTFNKVKP
jgi:hypothetical protein